MRKNEIQKSRVFVDFIPAQLSEGKSWEVYYYVKHPDTKKLKRIRIRVNRIKSITERRKYAKVLISELNNKLYQGWNPFLEQSAPKAYFRLFEALEIFLNVKIKEGKHNTIRSYKSYIKILKEYLEKNERTNISVASFSKKDARDFLNDVFIHKNLSNTTFNNYLSFYKILWNWLIEYSYISVNIFDGIKKKKESQKTRVQFIEDKYRDKIVKYLKTKNDYYLLAVKLAFHCLFRPRELTYLKISDINVSDQTIHLDGKFTKNGKTRYATIPNILMPEISELVDKYKNKNWYIFSYGFVPGKNHIDSRNISKRWDKLRNILSLPKEMQFYSLRDTGIIQKLRDGVSPDEVMYQADHHSLEVTNKYVKMAAPKVISGIKDKVSKF